MGFVSAEFSASHCHRSRFELLQVSSSRSFELWTVSTKKLWFKRFWVLMILCRAPLNFPPFCTKAEAWLVSLLVRVFIDTDDHKRGTVLHLRVSWLITGTCAKIRAETLANSLPLKLCHLQRLNCWHIFHLSMNLWGKISGAFVDVGWNVRLGFDFQPVFQLLALSPVPRLWDFEYFATVRHFWTKLSSNAVDVWCFYAVHRSTFCLSAPRPKLGLCPFSSVFFYWYGALSLLLLPAAPKVPSH